MSDGHDPSSGATGGIRSSRAPAPVGAYPHARRVGSLLFLSGIGPRVAGTDEIPGNVMDAAGRVTAHDIVRQTEQVFANVRVILEDAGSSWDRIVDVTVFLTDITGDFAAFNATYARHFGANQPTRTTVEVGALPTPIAIELKVIAEIGPMD